MEPKPRPAGSGESAIIVPVQVPVPVGRLRDRMDPSAAQGVPAHVTLLYPFKPPEALKDDVRRAVEQIVAAEPAFPFRLTAVGRWPNVVYLEPDPAEPFRRLTLALAAAFPDFPPYEGAHANVVPHLTIAQDVPEDYLAAAQHALPGMLPIRDFAREAWLIGHTPEQPWHTLWRLPLGEPDRATDRAADDRG
ncbi:MAG TPA: 2'-5' RNA ligase family protein [Candidatus Limnocylindrales bacterium]|nr:2'-5' RNA ligase family protein [Candidatus Limnocylindrales bacterium]